MKNNKAMTKLIRQYGESQDRSFPLNPKLVTLLDSGIKERDGVFLLVALEFSVSTPMSRFGDRTGYECAVNHVHLEDFLDSANQQDRGTLFRSGVAFAHRLNEKLVSTFPQDHFRIILSCNLDDPPGCVVRFHKVRAGENWIQLDDLEGYKSEAIMVIEVANG